MEMEMEMGKRTVRGVIVIPFDARVESDIEEFTADELVKYFNAWENEFASAAMDDDGPVGITAYDRQFRVVVIETVEGHLDDL